MKSLIISALFMSSGAMASNTHLSFDSCQIELHAGVKIQGDVVEFKQDNQPLYAIVNDSDLLVNGNKINLSASQQSIVTSYSQSIRSVVPEVKSVAVDAIDLAIQGVDLAFSKLLGDDNDISLRLTDQLSELRDDIDVNLDPNNFEIDSNGEMLVDVFGGDFEQRIERIVEDTVEQSMGSLLIALGKQMMSSNNGADSFEQRMEKFATEIESEMEARGEAIESRAQVLCDSFLEIDALEEQMKTQISELPSVDVFETNSKKIVYR